MKLEKLKYAFVVKSAKKKLTLFNSSLEIHLHDLLMDLHGSKIISLQREPAKVNLALLEVDFVIRYGVFGYGYSHQLVFKDLTLANTLKESLLFRSKIFFFVSYNRINMVSALHIKWSHH